MKKELSSIFTLLLLMAATMQAQDNKKPDWARWHYLSEAEMYDTSRGMNFIETDPPAGEPRFVAEFEPMQGVMIRYPLGIPTSLVAQLSNNCMVYCIVSSSYQYQAQNSFQNSGVNMSNVTFVNAPTDSYWVRDYGPWYIFEDRNPAIVDNIYNRPRPNDDNMSQVFANFWQIPMYGMRLEHTGGNMMEDGRGHGVSDDLVLTENGNNEANVRNKMRDYLGIDPYHITIDPQGDYIAHVDCWGKYLAPDKILIAQVPQSNSHYNDYESVANYFATTNCCWGYPYRVYRVDEPGGYTLAPYTNSLILNKTVYVPLGTNNNYNQQALAVYQEAMPGYEIIGVTSSGYSGWENTDALHCRTRGVMDFNMLFVDHRNVLFGEQAWQDSIPVVSKFIAYSGANLKQDSLLVYYSIDGGAYQTAHMTPTGNPDEYVGYIKGYQSESSINYYVFGADQSGHRYTQPVFAGLDPHRFTMEAHQPGDLVITPESLLFETWEVKTFNVSNGTSSPVTVSVTNFDTRYIASVTPQSFTLQPNQSINVSVELASHAYKGYIDTQINLATSVGDRQVNVRINENALGDGMLLWPMAGLYFDEDSPMTQTFWVRNTYEEESITLYELYEEGSDYFDITLQHSLPYVIPADGYFAVTVTLVNFPEQATDAIVHVRGSSQTYSSRFLHIAGGLSGGSGELVISPDTLWYEQLGQERNFVIKNETTETVTINQIESDLYALRISDIGLPYTLQAGQSVSVSVLLDLGGGKSDYNSYDIRVETSMGERHVTAKVKQTLLDQGLLVSGSPYLSVEDGTGAEGILQNRNYGSLTPIEIYSIAEDGTDYLIILPQHPVPYTLPAAENFHIMFYANSPAKGTVSTIVLVESSSRQCWFHVTINEDLLNVTELSAEAKLYPNPTTGQFTVEGANVAKVEVYNLVGQKVCEQQGSKVVNINATDWNKGLYFVNIIEENGAIVTKKLVVK